MCPQATIWKKKKKAHCKLRVYENNQQLNKGCQKMQTSSFKVSPGDVMYSMYMVSMVKSTVLHI